MQLKNDNNDNNRNNNFNNNYGNNNTYRPSHESFDHTYDDLYAKSHLDDDDPYTYTTNKVNNFDRSVKIETSSRNVSFNARSIFLIGLIVIYAVVMIPLFFKTLKQASTPDENATLVTEGYVKEVTTSRKQVTQGGGGVTVTSTEKVFTATYEFEVEGKKYCGEYDSLNEIKANTKIDVVYKVSDPSENHRQSAEESVKPKADKKSRTWFVFVVAAAIYAFVLYVIYRRIQMGFTGKTWWMR